VRFAVKCWESNVGMYARGKRHCILLSMMPTIMLLC
jgi:hypothetical protein